MKRSLRFAFTLMAAIVVCVSGGGCTSFREYVQNGLKVGPNYEPPVATVSTHWIDENDIRKADDPATVARWWTVFNDPKLDHLIISAYNQNLTLKQAGTRILEARALRDIVVGNIFPQTQTASGSYKRNGAAVDPANAAAANRFTDAWNSGFNLNWELDFWGDFAGQSPRPTPISTLRCTTMTMCS